MYLNKFDQLCFNHGQWESKIWLVRELEKVLEQQQIKEIEQVHVLGSWLGMLAMIMYTRDFPFKKVYNYDISDYSLYVSRELLNPLKVTGRLEQAVQDVNLLDYPVCDNVRLVCNTSIDNIPGVQWFDRIPTGSLVALQHRSGGQPDEVNSCNSLDEFKELFPVKETFFCEEKYFQYPINSYHRYMLIGVKG